MKDPARFYPEGAVAISGFRPCIFIFTRGFLSLHQKKDYTLMATLIQQPATLCFSSVMDDIIFTTEQDNAELDLVLIHGSNRMTVLEETLYPDLDGKITIGDLSSLLEPYAKQYMELTMQCTLTDTAGTASIQPVTVLYAMADVDIAASTFVSQHFLTILDGEKLTAIGREERLYAFSATQVTVTAEVRVSGVFSTITQTMNAGSTSGSISQFDVSPSAIADLVGVEGDELLAYRVEAGYRRQDFRCIEDPVPPAPSLLFTNSFGCQEFLHCSGTHQKTSKYERKTARISGRLRNYKVTEDRQFKANTGWLNEAMADWADDLFRSEEVYLWVDGLRGREVIVSESKSEISNEDDDMPAFEFTYSYSQRIHNVMQPTHAGRIFDNTFDHTFN